LRNFGPCPEAKREGGPKFLKGSKCSPFFTYAKRNAGIFQALPYTERFFHRRHTRRMSTEKIYHNTRADSTHVYQIIN
jgi:hypothetical protein